MEWLSMERVIGGKRYSTDKSTLIADDAYWDGHNYERQFRNRFLFRTQNSNYFLQALTMWQGEVDTLEPLSLEDAICEYESLPEQRVPFEEAFPSVEVAEA